MQKMPCLFQRDFRDQRKPVLLREVTPGCEWVLRGEGAASRKWDGTACAVINGDLYKRYDAKQQKVGGYKLPPTGAIPCCDPDPVTGHWPHWVIVTCDERADKWHSEAHRAVLDARYTPAEIKAMVERRERIEWLPDGTYELIGPHINGNPERVSVLEFKRHGDVVVDLRVPGALFHDGEVSAECAYEYLRTWLSVNSWEGLVFAHADGCRCKIRRADFGLEWPIGGR